MSTFLSVQVPAPPGGLVEVITLPRASTATHSDTDGHDTPISSKPDSTFATVQAPPPSAGGAETPLNATPHSAKATSVAGRRMTRHERTVRRTFSGLLF